MKKYQYLASWDDQTLTRVGEPVVVLGDSNVSQVEVVMPSNFLLDPTGAVARMYFLLPGEKESDFETLETATKDENGDSHVTWTIKHAHSQKGGRLAFSLTLIGDDAQWDSRTAIIPVYESRYQPESEEAEEPYTGRLDALEGSMASIRGEFTEVQEDFEELKETATLGTPIPESLVSNMTAGHVYIYTGTETGYTAGHVYYYVNGTLTDGGVYGGTAVDATLTKSGQAADAAVVGTEVSAIKEDLRTKTGLTDAIKTTLLNCFAHVAWTAQDGQTYYNALEAALFAAEDGLSAVYTQTGAVYWWDSLDYLKNNLIVTYTDGGVSVVVPSTDYALTGTLSAGVSIITVAYQDKVTTFRVAVNDGMQYRLSNSDVTMANGSAVYSVNTPSNDYGLLFRASDSSTRRAFFLDRGAKCAGYQTTSGATPTDSVYYPIPIPAGASKVTVTITPATNYSAESFWNIVDGVYHRESTDGWNLGGNTFDFTPGAYGYLAIAAKANESGSAYTSATNPTELVVTFE